MGDMTGRRAQSLSARTKTASIIAGNLSEYRLIYGGDYLFGPAPARSPPDTGAGLLRLTAAVPVPPLNPNHAQLTFEEGLSSLF